MSDKLATVGSSRSRIDAKVFRASVPVCAGGLLSICTDPSTGSVYCGAGDGALRKVRLREYGVDGRESRALCRGSVYN